MTFSDMQHAPDDDRWRRILVERPPPQSWPAIVGWGIMAAAGVALGLASTGGPVGATALLLCILGGLQVLRGLTARACLRLWGDAQPLRQYLRRRLDG
jgi:hypothetical protein